MYRVMDRTRHTQAESPARADRRDSILLIAAAVGLAAGIYLVRYETLFYELQVTILGLAIAASSTLAVFVRRRWVGALVIALSLAATLLLLAADFYTIRAVVFAIVALVAGAVILATSVQRTS